MMNWMILAVMMAMAALYTSSKPELDALIVSSRLNDRAKDMDVYRKSVIAYFAANPGQKNRGATPGDLIDILPSWSHMSNGNSTDWLNFRDGNGDIYIYSSSDGASVTRTPEFLVALYEISSHSSLAGSRSGNQFLSLNPVGDGTNVSLTGIPNMPNETAVWLAHVE